MPNRFSVVYKTTEEIPHRFSVSYKTTEENQSYSKEKEN